MDIIWTLAYASLVIILLQYLYKYLKKPYSYWEERGVPSVPALPLIGSLYDNFTKELRVVLKERYDKYGRVHGFYESSRPAITVGDPELLKDILVKDFSSLPNRRDFSFGDRLVDAMVAHMEGEEWKRVRTIITPAFSSGKIKKMTSIISDAAEITSNNFEKFADSGEIADCKKIFGGFTMDVIARTAFGTKIDSHNDPENAFSRRAKETFSRKVSLGTILFFISHRLAKFLGFRFFASNAFFEEVTVGIVKQRRASGQKQNDFIQLLMDAEDEVGTGKESVEDAEEDDTEKAIDDLGHDKENKQIFKATKKYKGLSQDELVAQCVLFFLAGYDTTSSTLSFASYLLALNPECQEKLIKEIDETLKRHNNKLTYEAVQSMKYLENVVWETMRVYPPAVSIQRKADEDYKLGSTGITITKGMVVNVPTYAIHHDPEFYENPDKFDPNRFTPEEKERRHPYTYLPFGAGPRNCIGMRFALIEIKFCIASLLSKFRLKRCSETKVPLDFMQTVQGMLHPIGIQLKVERRTDSVSEPNQ